MEAITWLTSEPEGANQPFILPPTWCPPAAQPDEEAGSTPGVEVDGAWDGEPAQSAEPRATATRGVAPRAARPVRQPSANQAAPIAWAALLEDGADL